jgi:hypothetical protein
MAKPEHIAGITSFIYIRTIRVACISAGRHVCRKII